MGLTLHAQATDVLWGAGSVNCACPVPTGGWGGDSPSLPDPISLIELTRDILSEYWIRTIAIKDIYYLKVEVDGAFAAQAHAGRGQGFTHAVIGLKP